MIEAGFGPDGTVVLKSMTLRHWDLPKPSIVAVNGLAVGGAANIALVNYHDMVVCSTDARFKYPFASLGFTPELGSSMMFPQTVGMARAKEIMFLGDWFSANEAKAMGLVNRVVAPEELVPTALGLADRLCKAHPAALKNAKFILNRGLREQMDRAMDCEQTQFEVSLRETGGPKVRGLNRHTLHTSINLDCVSRVRLFSNIKTKSCSI
jgi:enoyl-CoA hydratase/carnithine racemase